MVEDPSLPKFDKIFQIEMTEIRKRRPANDQLRTPECGASPSAGYGLTGLALSGGGVRSASFALGVLQALGARGLIRRMDYLSTVSGGGYIGTAMTIAMSENGGQFPFAKSGSDSDETPETKHLRDNSRYLIPNGFPSVISAAAVYMRGIVMNLLVVAPTLLTTSFALLVLHRAFGWLKDHTLPSNLWGFDFRPAAFSIVLGIVFIAFWALYAILLSLFQRRMSLRTGREWAAAAAIILAFVLIVSIMEFHVWLLDFHLQTALNGASKVVAPLIPMAVAVLPFVRRLANMATKATEDAGWSDFTKRVLSRAMLLLLGTVVPLALWLAAVLLAQAGLPAFCSHPAWTSLLYLCPAAALFLTWPLLSVNANSLHSLYRNRLGAAFLMRREKTSSESDETDKVVKTYPSRLTGEKETDLVSADDFRLSRLNTGLAPYHLINAALNVPGSKFLNMRGRNADFFLFSPRFTGSEVTGYISTSMLETMTGLNMGTAMAISGAAVAPNMGVASLKPLSPTIALLNLRLGRWVQHPEWIAIRAAQSWFRVGDGRYRRWRFLYPRPRYLLREAFFKTGPLNLGVQKQKRPSSTDFLFLTDGGHIENLGVYELLRRRCKIILAVDGEADPSIACHSLVQLERFARIDLNTRITIDWHPIGERTRQIGQLVKSRRISYQAGPHVALGLIEYPSQTPEGPHEYGLLIYIKASLSGDENDYVMGYKAQYSSFPHETTADQVFTEEQLEVYRALGEHITKRFLGGDDMVSAFKDDHAKIAKLLHEFLPELRVKFVVDPARRFSQRSTTDRQTVAP